MMEPSVRVVFEHLDSNGDEVRITTTRHNRLTVGIREGGVGCRAYLSRDAATMLRQALDAWLSEPIDCVRCGHSPESHTGPSTCLGNRNLCGCELSRTECLDRGRGSERREHWCGLGEDHPRHPHTASGEMLECLGVRAEIYGPEETEATEPEACAAAPKEDPAPYRLEALRLAVSLAPTGADRMRVFEVAEEFARYLATGETPEPAPVIVPRDMVIVESAVAAGMTDLVLCGLCQHRTHGAGRCTEGGRGLHRCKCGEALSAGTCGVCQHLFHGTVICADGAKGAGPRCECRGRAEDYQR